MRSFLRLSTFAISALVSALVLFGFAADARADYPIVIKNVRVGFPAGPLGQQRDENNQSYPIFKAAAWAPVWVELGQTARVEDEKIRISVETADGDDVLAVGSVIVEPLGREFTIIERIPYVKPGGVSSDIKVSVRGATTGKVLAEPWQRSLPGIYPSRYLILSVGAALPGLRLTHGEGLASEEVGENEPVRNGWVELAQITRVSEMPDQWFGYQAVDLMVLCTAADPKFWTDLAADARRRSALREWVARGGRLVVSVGTNPGAIRALPELLEILPARLPVNGQRSVAQIGLVLPNSPRMLLVPATGSTVVRHAIEPIAERPYLLKLAADERDNPPPLVVQAAYGIGRVTLVLFDLDVSPMVEWKHREAFWEWLINNSSSRLPTGAERATAEPRTNESEDEYVNRLQSNLDFFEGVPVISFGWVALFMLLYILLIGPIEYLFLKKLLKRLEWTWLTFPIIVASTCTLAWFTAHAVKGRDMKVNKIDLVDIDLRTQRAYGRTWFALYSQDNQDYTIGIEPAGPRADGAHSVWFRDDAAQTAGDTVISWQGRAKSSRQSLFRRSYRYHVPQDPDGAGRLPFANGLEHVPIQVWSTKAFTANWSAHLDPDKPLFVSTLRVAESDSSQITGSITSKLPIELLLDAQLVYRDRIVVLPALTRGTPRFVSTNPQSVSTTISLQTMITQKDLLSSNRTGRPKEDDDDPDFRLWSPLFHETITGHIGRLWNASFRDLDQSWRSADKNPYEAMLIARIGRVEGPAEEMTNSPNSPTRLWLNAIPGQGRREPLTGTLRQETYIRVFIPIVPVNR
jgi:hypothetical protein